MLMPVFCKAMAERVDEVLKQNQRVPLVSVNAARILEALGRTGCPEVADVATAILEDPDHNDGTRLYACKALKELFALSFATPPVLVTPADREKKAVEAVLKLLERLKAQPGLPREERDGVRYLRREAVRALAMSRLPAVGAPADAKGRSAEVLLRVLCQDGFEPSPRVDEQLEAAIGLARKQAKLLPEYQPDYAAWHLGHFVVRLAAYYNEGGKPARDQQLPWRTMAYRLADALDGLREENKMNKDIVEWARQSITVLKAIEAGNNTVNATVLAGQMPPNPPGEGVLFKGVANSAVTKPDRVISDQ
jgi:hypothetical protein